MHHIVKKVDVTRYDGLNRIFYNHEGYIMLIVRQGLWSGIGVVRLENYLPEEVVSANIVTAVIKRA